MKRLNNFLCKIGLHDWACLKCLNDRDLSNLIPTARLYCKKCGETH